MAQQVDVVEASGTDVEIYSPALLAKCKQQDPEKVLARFAQRFEKAKNLDDLFDAVSGTNSQQLVGKKLEIRSVDWAPYESDRGTIPLGIVQGFDLEDGTEMEFATTSGMLCLWLYRAQGLNLLPAQVRIEGKKTNSGQTALNFVRP